MIHAGAAAEIVVEARQLRRAFGRRVAVDGIDLAIARGEVFGLLGPNGAGKSTLFRMLLGMLAPTSGEVRVFGLDLPRQAELLRHRLGFMTQRFSLYEDLTVGENLDFVAAIFGLEPELRRRRVEEALAEFTLGDRRRQRAGELSGGLKQRLALAAATVHRPELLVLDEPTAGVDPEQRRLFWEKIFELAGDGVTVLVSTHSMDEAVRCHRLCLLRSGRVVALGAPRALADALDGRVVEVAAEPPEAAVAALRRLPEVASVTQLGETLHVLLEPGGPTAEEAAAAFRRHLATEGLLEVAATAARPSLEDAFVAATLGDTVAPPGAPPGAPEAAP